MCPSLAEDGIDFRGISKEVIFDENSENPQRVYVPILNDDCVEYDEYFLVNVTTNMDCVLLVNSVHVTILDDDCKL